MERQNVQRNTGLSLEGCEIAVVALRIVKNRGVWCSGWFHFEPASQPLRGTRGWEAGEP